MKKKIDFHKVRLALARKNFYEYCKLRAPSFYRDDRPYIKTLCDTFEEVLTGDTMVTIVNLPPRHGKSRTATNFTEYIFGQDTKLKVMTGSYNEILSTTFSRTVRNNIQEAKAEEDKLVYSDIFPATKIKRGDGAINLWSLEGGHANYLSTSPRGTATGFGANLIIIDDIIKNAYEAYNELSLEKNWDWFTNTMFSRLEEGGKILVVMTRWATNDLAGRLIAFCEDNGIPFKLVTMKAVQDDGTMLCDDVLSRDSFEFKIKAMNPEIASANYQQEPIDVKGRLYSGFFEYDGLTFDDFDTIKNYTDTADEGADYLCSITYGVRDGKCYVLDVIYTKAPMEETEPLIADTLYRFKVQRADIESNNGGRGFGRAVKKEIKERYRDYTPNIKMFYQALNKAARIISNSTAVMNSVYFPTGWQQMWPEFAKDLINYQREGQNIHDDAPDTITGVYEKGLNSNPYTFG